MVMRDSFAESSRMNHLMRQKSAAFRKKRGFRVQRRLASEAQTSFFYLILSFPHDR